MQVVFQGLESPSHRVTLKSLVSTHSFTGVNAGISYKTLKSRRLSNRYVAEVSTEFDVFIEAGVSQSSMPQSEALAFAREYYSFSLSVPDITHIVEFDHPSLDAEAREEIIAFRARDERIVPVWYPEEGIPVLQTLIVDSARIGMGVDSLADRRVPGAIRKARQPETLVLAMGISKFDEVIRSGVSHASTSAWLAPASFGEFIFFDGGQMHRSPSSDREDMVRRFEGQIEAAGFDVDLVREDDFREMSRLAGYSFLSWAAHLADNTGISNPPEPSISVSGPTSTGVGEVEVRKERRLLPIFSTDVSTSVETDEDGASVIRERTVLKASGDSLRMCDSCYLAGMCPAYTPGDPCAFNFPVEVRTPAQLKSLLNSVIELQASRVAFAKFAEEVNGGYPDETVSKEMDRLFRMAESAKKVEERRERLTVSVEHEESGNSSGVLSAIFGRSVPEPPSPSSDEIIAEVIEDS